MEQLLAPLRRAELEHGPLPNSVRKGRLLSLRLWIKEHEQAMINALSADLGKPAFEAYATEIGFILEEIRRVLKNLDHWTKVKKVATPLTLWPGRSYIIPCPLGLVLIISPWNYPFQLCLGPLLGALAAGNRVVLKPSEFTPETNKIIKDMINDVFRPDEVVVIEGGVRETEQLLKHKFDHIFFTGSTAVGKVIMKVAAEKLTPVTLELGGKSPCLLLEDADMDVAAKRCAWGKFLNAGQSCVAPDYVLVPVGRQEEFIERLRFHLRTFYGESPLTSPNFGKIINTKNLARLKGLLIEGKVAIGGKIEDGGCRMEPTVLKDVTWQDQVMQEEIFGPLLPILPYKELDETLRQVWSMPRPLAFYIFCSDEKKGLKILSKLPFGGGCLNDTVVHLANPNLPFGGVGTSGMGAYHGKKSFDTFTHQKSIYQKGKLDNSLRYPPYEGKMNWLKFFLR